MKVDFVATDAAEVIRKLRRALYSARARARSWKEASNSHRLICEVTQRVLREVQSQRDYLLNRCDQLEHQVRSLQLRCDRLERPLDQFAQAQQQSHQLAAQAQQQQYYSALAQAQQGLQQQAYQNNLQDIDWRERQNWCNCVPARHDLLLPR